MAYRDNRHHRIELALSSNYLNLFKPKEHTEDYHIRKQTMKFFFSKVEMKKTIMWKKK